MGTMNKVFLVSLMGLLVLAAMVFVFRDQVIQMALASQPPAEAVQIGLSLDALEDGTVEIIAEDLSVPWAIDFLPSGDLLVTERPGRLLRVGMDAAEFEIEDVEQTREGGLLGLALHPNFQNTRWLYI